VKCVSSTPVLRPLGVGEILDAALAVYRRHAFALWKIVAVVVALPAALNGALAVAQRQVRDSNSSASGSLVVLELLFVVVTLVALSLATAAAYRFVADAYLQRAVDADASLRFGLKRIASVMWVSIIVGVGVFCASIFLLIPGVYLYVAWSVSIPVLLAENLRGRQALGRSRALVRGHFWPCLGVLALSFLLQVIVLFAVIFVLAAIVDTTGNDTLLFFEQSISTLIANTLVLPFQIAVTTVLYIDLRVRKEGFDVQLLSHALEPGGAGET
jgi:hypothetical protein